MATEVGKSLALAMEIQRRKKRKAEPAPVLEETTAVDDSDIEEADRELLMSVQEEPAEDKLAERLKRVFAKL